MNEIFKKLSSYNIFNYLLPGIIFAIFVQRLSNYKLIQDDIIIGAFLYYFLGLIISRIGSLIVEPFLRWIKFLKLLEYNDYIIASRSDSKLEILSEQNNMHRTFISMLILLILLEMYRSIRSSYVLLMGWDKYLLIILLIVLFLGAYKKQTIYISRRINLNKK